jgi:SAM-dependent methyltransferase
MGMTAERTPLRLVEPGRFKALREFLGEADFTEAGICRRLGIPSFNDFGDARLGSRFPNGFESPQDVLIRLFLGCETAQRSEVEHVLGCAALELLEEAGLLEPDPADPGRSIAPVGLCPTRGLYLVSDRGPAASPQAGDLVYPAILENTQDFLNSIPDARCGSLLDLGTGTGVAALLAARDYAGHAWACDITPRSAHFAEFNRRLNGIDNVTVARGDLYEAVGGRMFDRIVTHPPYVPVSNPTWIFRDGGDDGETIVRRAIEGLPRHLAPGGRFCSLTLISDRQDEPAESRVRAWLGDAGPEFDVAVIAETTRPPLSAARCRRASISWTSCCTGTEYSAKGK